MDCDIVPLIRLVLEINVSPVFLLTISLLDRIRFCHICDSRVLVL